MIDLLQYIGSLILILHKLPQLYRAYKNRNELKDLSLVKYILGTLGGVVMAAWGAGTGNLGIVFLNVYLLVNETIVLGFIVRVIRRKRKKKYNHFKSVYYLENFSVRLVDRLLDKINVTIEQYGSSYLSRWGICLHCYRWSFNLHDDSDIGYHWNTCCKKFYPNDSILWSKEIEEVEKFE